MKLIVLGSGTCVPSLKRNASGYYLEATGLNILIDCGNGVLLQLERAGKSYKNIDAVFITHTHPDHVSDLVAVLHATLAAPGLRRIKDLLLAGPEDFGSYYKKCVASCLSSPKTFGIDVTEVEDKFMLGDLQVFAAPSVHSAQGFAYRFEAEGKSVVITGDSDYDRGLVDLSRNADLLIADCSYPDSLKVAGHMTPSECGRLAAQARVKRLLLSHIYPGDYEDSILLEECMKVFGGDVSLAEDLMEIDLS
ncbi:MAG: MBL fold metallo-hydrolase [Nitrospirota bacterium]